MTPAGEIHIELTHRGGQAISVNIVSTRPETATRVLLGKTPEQVLACVPLLFSLCGDAQAYAALLACRAALDLEAQPQADAARELLLQVETLREHSWRILLDWPGLLGLAPDKTSVAALLKITARIKPCLFREGEAFSLESRLHIDVKRLDSLSTELTDLLDLAIFGGELGEFQSITHEAHWRDWLTRNSALPAQLLNTLYRLDWLAAGRNELKCLPVLNNPALHRQLLQSDLSAFSSAPHWQGQCYESTPLHRQLTHPLIAELHGRYGNGLLVRFSAVLQEVATYLPRLKRFGEAMSMPASSHGAGGIGLAQVQAARGLLIHRLALQQGRVYDYRIVAPTEWNFHPNGVVAQGLKQLRGEAASMRRQAEWLINAVDPCVAYRLVLREE